MPKLLFTIFLSLTLHGFYPDQSHAVQDDDIHLGSGSDKLVRVKVALTFDQIEAPGLEGVFQVGGIMTVISKTTGKEADCVIQGTMIDRVLQGSCTYFGANGKKVKVKLGGLASEENNTVEVVIPTTKKQAISFRTKKFKSPDISGSWDFVNDPAGDMKIVTNGSVSKYIGTYSGTGAHSNLRGTLKGAVKTSLNGETTWTGSFVIKELSTKVNGSFVCTYSYVEPSTMSCQFSGGSSAAFQLAEK